MAACAYAPDTNGLQATADAASVYADVETQDEIKVSTLLAGTPLAHVLLSCTCI